MRISDWSSDVCSSDLNFAELCFLVDLLPDHTGQVAEPIIAQRPALPLRLVARPSKPVPLVVRPIAAAPSIQPLDYQSLDEPAPIAHQVGTYLPYRPSRIPITGSVEHPPPPVEPAGMGPDH